MTSPIDLYYWPTPNGWKISIALEGMALPYKLHLVDIGAGDQFDPDVVAVLVKLVREGRIDPTPVQKQFSS